MRLEVQSANWDLSSGRGFRHSRSSTTTVYHRHTKRKSKAMWYANFHPMLFNNKVNDSIWATHFIYKQINREISSKKEFIYLWSTVENPTVELLITFNEFGEPETNSWRFPRNLWIIIRWNGTKRDDEICDMTKIFFLSNIQLS